MPDVTKLSAEQRTVVAAFHDLHWEHNAETRWLGHQALKSPLDLFMYQEIIFELTPDLIIECGTYKGGSAIFLASMCKLVGRGEVISIDAAALATPESTRLTYWTGDTLDPALLERLAERTKRLTGHVMVILDDDHERNHVLHELRAYARFVTPHSYLIVEDTNIGHPVQMNFGPGPCEAVDAFLAENQSFESDRSRERYLISFNPRGYLRKR